MRLAVLALVAISFSATTTCHAAAGKPSCPGYEDGKAYPANVDRFYASRAVAIVRAAMAGDADTLRAQVSPDARFTIWRGDVGLGRDGGVKGAIEMARNLNPDSFSVMIRRYGPIREIAGKCLREVTILFRTKGTPEGVAMVFKFSGGILIGGTGHEVEWVEGSLR